jgi:hypothetical protein
MTKLLDAAIEKVRQLSPERQDEIAASLLGLADAGDVYVLSAEERAELEDADAEISRGEIATDEEVQAFWKKIGL